MPRTLTAVAGTSLPDRKFMQQAIADIATLDASLTSVEAGTIVYNKRSRVTIANVNAGATLLPAIVGKSYRLVKCRAVAYGGAVGALTTADVLATVGTSSVKLVAFAQASLTQSTVLTDGGTGAAVLADGASYVACDANTAITVAKTGSSGTTATGIDFIISYTIE